MSLWGDARGNRTLTSLATLLAALFVVATVWAGCGDDAPPTKPPAAKKGAKQGRTAARGKKKSGKKGKAVEVYPKVPDEYRHRFDEKDFAMDLVGDENRDPFRSYVLAPRGPSMGAVVSFSEDTEICTKENSVATTYQLRNLGLLGIVLRGTRSYALFRDSSGYGHIVRRGDCLGKEKARVEAIGAGFVRLTVVPETPPGAPAPAPQTRDIQLHPEEMSFESVE